ncbi:MAG: efflux RND transporter periplasmic adaptor subunit [Chlamydiota bacterium]
MSNKWFFCILGIFISTGFANQPTKGGLEKPYPIVGNLKPLHQTKIGTQVSGRVKEIFVDMGDSVTKGQVLVSLDPVFLLIELKKLTALYEMSQASFEESDLEMHRLQPLWEKNPPSISKKTFEDAQIRLKLRKAQMDQSFADLQNTKQRLLEMDIVAPYAGKVVKRCVDYGESVTTMPAVTVAEMIDDSKLIFEFSLPQDLVGQIDENTKLSLEVSGFTKPYLGTVKIYSPLVEESTRTFRCQASIDNTDGKMHSGLFAKGILYLKGRSTSFHAPKTAFVQERGKWFAKVKENDVTVLKPVELSFVGESEVEIQSGLQEQDNLIIE